MFGPELVEAFREFKSIWDPEGRMNPGRIVDPDPITSNLKLGSDYVPKPVDVRFAYPDDGGSFAHAALRCVGVGECRRLGGGTMCPSFMVTRDERHTTRGRARVLFEMMNGAEIDPWKSEDVFEALELCLSCKGCKSDCPVGVDMATYKAEFLSHYYRGRVRPRVAYAMGLIPWWARLASVAPGLANAATSAPVVGDLLKRAGGIAPERAAPRFARETFRRWFERRGPRGDGRRRVVLWPDTFTNAFDPDIGKAHVRVLEAAGFTVSLPRGWVCCGRPLYDYGMLGLAQRLLHRTIDSLRDDIRAGTPVVGMEPSCVATFRDELPGLLPHDRDATRLSGQTVMLSELLSGLEGWRAPTLRRRALVDGHCHHKAVMGFEAERDVLGRVGLDVDVVEAGCCGMAGSFGFERGEKYEVSVRAGERVLLPAVRAAAGDTLVVTDGFSCRTQIGQGTGRSALHLAQVLALALDQGGGPASGAAARDPHGARGHRG
jgi:Fe-S oxidoreductase